MQERVFKVLREGEEYCGLSIEQRVQERFIFQMDIEKEVSVDEFKQKFNLSTDDSLDPFVQKNLYLKLIKQSSA